MPELMEIEPTTARIPDIRKWIPGMEMTPGFYDIPAAAYHSRDNGRWPVSLSASIARTIALESPMHGHLKHPQLGAAITVATPEMDQGSVVHALVLGRGSDIAVGNYADWRTAESQAFKAAARRDFKIPILAGKLATAIAQAETLKRQILASDQAHFYDPETLSEICGVFEWDGMLCQFLMDRVNFRTGEIWDLKTTDSVHPRAVAKKVVDMAYDVQARFYTRGFQTLVPWLEPRFTFIWSETTAPFAYLPGRLSYAGVGLGDWRLDRALAGWKHGMATGVWPAYGATTLDIDTPTWAIRQEMGTPTEPSFRTGRDQREAV